ncbi:DUF2599 domain-containing protein [Nocardia sp. NPDC005366]|uniref:DUF2599 domain-containing protein n=1 Tax=Nocardia sp. NPDC005366 TaxID=3156878 RepID=UPI0033B46E2C
MTACLAVILVFAGCGSEDSTTAPPTAATPTPETAVTPPPAATPSASQVVALPTFDPYADLPLIDHVEWTETEDGTRLLVYPTVAGRRTTSPGNDERAWQEVLSQSPDAESPGMRDQFICHWEWARLVQPNKPSWNLEPWRPAVGYQGTVQASCNPGGPER